MKKIKEWTRQNYPWAAAAAFILLLLVLYQFIFMYSDDFRYGEAGKGNLQQIAAYMGEHYQTVNGRTLVHTLAILFTKQNLFFWRLATPAAIGAVMVLIAKFSATNRSDYRKGIVCACFLYLLLPVGVLQQSTYWLSGSFNYLYPLLPILFLGVLLKKSIIQGKANYWLLLLGILSGATMEQCGMIALGLCVLTMLYQRVWEKRKILPVHYLTVLSVLLGYITIFLSPATRGRVQSESGHIRLLSNAYRILIEKWFMAKEVYPIVLLTVLCILFWLIYAWRKKMGWQPVNLICICVLSLGLPLVTAGVYAQQALCAPMAFWKGIAGLYGAFFYFSLCYTGLCCYRKTGNESVPMGMILAIGAQVMLIAAAYIGFRNSFPTIIFLFPFYIQTILQCWNHACSVTRVQRCVRKWVCLIGLACVLLNTGMIFYGYCSNAAVYRENLQRIEAYHNQPQKVLYLKSFPYKNYRWYLPCDDASGGQAIGFKQYHEISPETELIFETDEKGR